MKSFKKLLAVVLSLAMVLGSLTVTAMAADNTVEVTIGETTTGYENLIAATTAISEMDAVDVTATIKLLADQNLGSTRLNPRPKTTATSNKRILTFDLNGKTITYTGESNGWVQINNISTYIIKNGTVDTGKMPFIGSAGKTSKGSTVTMEDLTWKTTLKGTETYTWQYGAQTIVINSGVFNLDPTSYTTGTVTKTGDKEWTVAGAAKVCEIVGGEKFTSFDAGIAALASAGTGTLKLLADCTKTGKVTTIAVDKDVTLDLNGFALTNTHDVTQEQSGASSTNNRFFNVKGTLTITDSSADKTGSMTVNDAATLNGGITQAEGGTVYVTGGNFFTGAKQTPSTNNCWLNKKDSGGTHQISGGWFAESARPTNNETYVVSGSSTIEVVDAEKAATPYTITSTSKTIAYSKNAKDATGNVDGGVEYYLEGYKTAPVYAKTNQYTYSGYAFMGWSTNSQADPDTDPLIAAGAEIDLTQYAGDEIQFFAIWKKVDKSMWVCVKTGDPETGYASIAAALAAQDDVTLIKNYTLRDTINSDGTLNLNGYNITPTEQGSALVIKAAVSIKNFDAGTITVDGTDYNFGGQGIVQGTAQGTGGAIDAGEGATVKIYGGTFIGDAPNHGTVLTCSKTGMFLIYGGTFAPSNAESEIDTFYANNSKIYVIPENQSDVKMTGTFAKNTSGEIGLQGGWFSELQPEAIVGTYDDVQGNFTADDTKALVANTGDANYPYSVASAWKIDYVLNGGENDPLNPATVERTDATAIALQPATKTGYTFTGWTDADGNAVTTITGTELTADLTLTANFEEITYSITYDNLYEATAPELTSYTVEDNVTLPTPTREKYVFTGWKAETDKGEAVTDWKAGERTGDIKLWATWSSKEAIVIIDGVSTYYATFVEAAEAVKTVATATIKLNKNIELTSRFDFRNATIADLTIDLGGKNITKTGYTNSGLFIYSGKLTITGSGTVTDKSTNSATSGNRSIACQAADATLLVEGGTFVGFVKATSNASSTATGAGATITGGTFSFDPKDSIDEYHYTSKKTAESGDTWTVNTCAATITVGETTTVYKYMTGTSATTTNYALDNVTEGCTLTLLKDTAAAFEFKAAISFTLDMNGFQYEDIATKLTAASPLGVDVKLIEGEEDVYTVTVADYSPYRVYVEGQEAQNFTTLADAVAAVLAAGETAVELKFFEDATITERIALRSVDSAEDTTARNITINLNGKTLTKGAEMVGMFFANKESTVTVKNGTLDAGTYKGSYLGGNACQYYAYDLTCVNGVVLKASAPKLTIYSGSYNADPTDYLAEGLIAKQNTETTMYNLEAAAASITDAKGYKNYQYMNGSSSAKSALPNIKDGDTVTLWKNALASYEFDSIMTFTLDKNGFTYDLDTKFTVAEAYDELIQISITLVEGDVYTVAITAKDPTYFEVTSVGGTISESLGLTIYVTSTMAQKDLPKLTFDQGYGTKSVEAKAMKDSFKYYYRVSGIYISNIDVDLGIKIGDNDLEGNIQSVLDYYNSLAAGEIAEETPDVKTLNLLADTVVFAQELQKATKKAEIFTPEEWVETYATTATPSETVKACTVAASDKTNYKIKSASALVNDKIQLIFYVYATDITSKKVELDVNGTKILVSLATEGVVKTSEANVYRITLDKINPADYSTTYTAQLYLNDAADHAVTYSVNSYCYSMQGSAAAVSNTTTGALALALYRFGVSYNTYKA